MSPIVKILQKEIESEGPVTVSRLMELCMSHPEHGYYMAGCPIGKEGDYTTSPEISQAFGELIGVWAISIWRQMNRPKECLLIELGPGRGTMMADFLRGAHTDEEFFDSLGVHLVETSPALRQEQEKALATHINKITWHEKLENVPEGQSIILANEFFDALPLHQYIKQKGQWHERLIDINGEAFTFTTTPLPDEKTDILIPHSIKDMDDGTVYEYRPAARPIIQQVGERISTHHGGALIIDYGHVHAGVGETLQAIHKHQTCNVLAHIGSADLTAHVDFEALIKAAGDVTPYTTTQGMFLAKLGIQMRTDILAKETTEELAHTLRESTQRLIHPDQMGKLFKVLALLNKSLPAPYGFR